MKSLTLIALVFVAFVASEGETVPSVTAVVEGINNVVAKDSLSIQAGTQLASNILVNSAAGLAAAGAALPQTLDQWNQALASLPAWASEPVQMFLGMIPQPLYAEFNKTLSSFPTLNDLLNLQLAAIKIVADASNQLAALLPTNQQIAGIVNGLVDSFNDVMTMLFPWIPTPDAFLQMLYSFIPPDLIAPFNAIFLPNQGEFDLLASGFTAAAQAVAAFAQTVPSLNSIVTMSLDFLPSDIRSAIPQDFLNGLGQAAQGFTVNDLLALSAQLLTMTAQAITDSGSVLSPNPSFLQA